MRSPSGAPPSPPRKYAIEGGNHKPILGEQTTTPSQETGSSIAFWEDPRTCFRSAVDPVAPGLRRVEPEDDFANDCPGHVLVYMQRACPVLPDDYITSSFPLSPGPSYAQRCLDP